MNKLETFLDSASEDSIMVCISDRHSKESFILACFHLFSLISINEQDVTFLVKNDKALPNPLTDFPITFNSEDIYLIYRLHEHDEKKSMVIFKDKFPHFKELKNLKPENYELFLQAAFNTESVSQEGLALLNALLKRILSHDDSHIIELDSFLGGFYMAIEDFILKSKNNNIRLTDTYLPLATE